MSGLRLDRCCVVEPGYDCYYVDRSTLDVALLCKNNQDGGSARASPVAAPMPKSVLSERKGRLLRGANMSRVEMCIRIGVPFSDGAA